MAADDLATQVDILKIPKCIFLITLYHILIMIFFFFHVQLTISYHWLKQRIDTEQAAGNFMEKSHLTYWGRVTHICVSKLAIIGSDNGLSPGRRQAIIGTNAGLLLIGPLGRNFSEILIKIHTFSFKKMHLKMSSEKWRPFCLSLYVLKKNRLSNVVVLPNNKWPLLLTWFNFNPSMDK